MRAQYIWRDCLVKELNISGPWQNIDAMLLSPPRQDLFWVAVNKSEIDKNLLYGIKDKLHFTRVLELLKNSTSEEFYFMITRNADYIQHYPYMNLNCKYSSWEKIPETVFNDLKQLSYIMTV